MLTVAPSAVPGTRILSTAAEELLLKLVMPSVCDTPLSQAMSSAGASRMVVSMVKLRLGDCCYQVTRELPYGRQRLLEIALALATRPRVLLLDEPAAGVPQEDSGDIFEVVAGLSDDLTLLFIEHDMHVVFRFASHIIVLVGGAVFTEGSPAEIAADPGVREVYLGTRKHG